MNGAPKRLWRIAAQDRAAAMELARTVGVHPVVAQLLLARGVTSEDAAREFLNPALRQLGDPFALTDMRAAVDRIAAARQRNEHVRVFGDYDVDGIAACAILHAGLRRFGVDRVSCGLPQRLVEGYGISVEHVDAAHADDVSLIITVDNGVRAYDAAARARELGIDLIITDHHAVDGLLPEAVAVINPKRDAADLPTAHLCGAGIAFKLSEALNGSRNDLDLAALGTVADIVPLLGENRVIVALGLKHMARYARTSLAQLADVAGLNVRELRARHLGFHLAPRLNAAGRLSDGRAALRLLLEEDAAQARELAVELHAANDERRDLEKRIYDEAVAELEHVFTPEQRTIVLARRGWHSGVIGIVATRVQTHFFRPVTLIAIDDDGMGKGSARSIPGFDLVGAFAACVGTFEQYGGHQAAAGLTIREENIPAFREAFEAEALRRLGPDEILPALDIDGPVSLSEIDGAFMSALARLEPFGNKNPAPLFCALEVDLIPHSPRALNGGHVKFAVRQGGRVFDVVGFGFGEWIRPDAIPRRLDIAFVPETNTYRGETSIQLVLRDLRPAGKTH
ncbi:MAG TPA: single-stranded-DNA-specific exonuclease RecJ [Candidatus Hydrogenedentes bacterium]|nr:single-stranded-DNA-specific exonuclease RecJ [Candidatus Hydrogenedentota bacterium]HNT88759.1 single-stranded-DNA-specific exonuclease RecJ [Candidatus Hydrogenedentota bacterium]